MKLEIKLAGVVIDRYNIGDKGLYNMYGKIGESHAEFIAKLKKGIKEKGYVTIQNILIEQAQ